MPMPLPDDAELSLDAFLAKKAALESGSTETQAVSVAGAVHAARHLATNISLAAAAGAAALMAGCSRDTANVVARAVSWAFDPYTDDNWSLAAAAWSALAVAGWAESEKGTLIWSLADDSMSYFLDNDDDDEEEEFFIDDEYESTAARVSWFVASVINCTDGQMRHVAQVVEDRSSYPDELRFSTSNVMTTALQAGCTDAQARALAWAVDRVRHASEDEWWSGVLARIVVAGAFALSKGSTENQAEAVVRAVQEAWDVAVVAREEFAAEVSLTWAVTAGTAAVAWTAGMLSHDTSARLNWILCNNSQLSRLRELSTRMQAEGHFTLEWLGDEDLSDDGDGDERKKKKKKSKKRRRKKTKNGSPAVPVEGAEGHGDQAEQAEDTCSQPAGVALPEILAHAGLMSFHEALLENGFDTVDVLRCMEDSDFDHLGMKLGHRKKLRMAIVALAPQLGMGAADVPPSRAAGSSEDWKLCVVCLDSEATHALDPCFHRVVCEPCGGSLRTCPICRSKVARSVRIYN